MSPKDKGDYAEGKWLRNRRRANGLKQHQVAARLGERNQGRVSENGRTASSQSRPR